MVKRIAITRAAMKSMLPTHTASKSPDDLALAVIVGILAALAVGSVGLFVMEIIELFRYLGAPAFAGAL